MKLKLIYPDIPFWRAEMSRLALFIGGLDFIRTIITGNVFTNFWADISKLMMLVTGLFFTIQCIRSFIHARRAGKTES